MTKLDDEAIRALLTNLEGWVYQDGAIWKRVKFESYAAVIGFVNQVAALAEKHNHHPDLTVKYGDVVLRYTTHDAGGVTRADLDAAKRIDDLLY